MIRLATFWSAFLLLVSAYGTLSAGELEQALQAAQQKKLAAQRYWLVLGHYRADLPGSAYTSEIDDPDFFLAARGKHDPAAELNATLEAMLAAGPAGNGHARCRFPARYLWLVRELDLDNNAVECDDYTEWRATLNAGSVTLVFPASIMNSPSSMFGHTLLRINPADSRKDTPLTAYALNYAANAVPDMNGLVYSYKGLFGGFAGQFSIVPYYEKISQYNDMESRDIWEYELNLNADEIDRLMAHTWELRDMQSDYFFFDENCSYMLLTVLEAARHDVSLLKEFAVKAIPADTVRTVYDNGMIESRAFRASSSTTLIHHLRQMSPSDRERVLELSDLRKESAGQQQASGNDVELARIYETTYDYLRYLASRDGPRLEPRARRSYAMLAARSRIAVASGWQPVPVPRVPPEQGHGTSRISIGAGHAFNEFYLALQYRPAFHDLLDDPEGFAVGSQINFFNVDARYFPDENAVELKRFQLIDIISLSPRDAFFRPWSWQAQTGLVNIGSPDDEIYAYNVAASGGVSYRVGEQMTLGALAGGAVDVTSELESDYRIGPSLELIGLWRFQRGSAKLSLKGVEYFPDTPAEYTFRYDQSHYLNRDYALRFSVAHNHQFKRSDSDVRIDLHYYY